MALCVIDQPLYHFKQIDAATIDFRVVSNSIITMMISDDAAASITIKVDILCAGDTELIFFIKRSKDISIFLDINLLVSYGSITCAGVYYTQDTNLDVQFRQFHHVQQTHGSFFLAGIAYENARINFSGNLSIEKNAEQSSGVMTHKTLMCGKNTCIKSIPNLEIKNNNVSCKHAASIWQLDREALFYMQSKGIEYDVAKKLLIKSFFEDSRKFIRSESGKQFFNETLSLYEYF